MKSGLGQPPLPQPEVALAGEQSISEEALVRAQDAALDEFARLIYEHFLDVVRVVDVVHAKLVEAHRHDIPVFAREGGEKAKRVAAVIFEGTRSRSAQGAGRHIVFDGATHRQMLCPAPVSVNARSPWNVQPVLTASVLPTAGCTGVQSFSDGVNPRGDKRAYCRWSAGASLGRFLCARREESSRSDWRREFFSPQEWRCCSG